MDSSQTNKVSQFPFKQAERQTDADLEWTGLLKKHNAGLRQMIAAKLGDETSVAIEDVMQEVHLAAHATPIENLEKSKIGAWLRQVAMHKIQDHWRAVERRRRLKQGISAESNATSPHSPASPATPAEWVLKIEQQEQIQQCLRQLPTEDRQLLEQKYLHEQPYDDIARNAGLSLKAVEYRLTRARNAMRKLLTSPRKTTIS